jgi:hypothetical protein
MRIHSAVMALVSATFLVQCNSAKSSPEQPTATAKSPSAGSGGACTDDDDCALDARCANKSCAHEANASTIPAPADAHARLVGTWRFDVSAVRSLPMMKGKTEEQIKKAEAAGKDNYIIFRAEPDAVGWAPLELHWTPKAQPGKWRIYEWKPGTHTRAVRGDVFMKMIAGPTQNDRPELKVVFFGPDRMQLLLENIFELPYVRE